MNVSRENVVLPVYKPLEPSSGLASGHIQTMAIESIGSEGPRLSSKASSTPNAYNAARRAAV